jgi:hypothetical protein
MVSVGVESEQQSTREDYEGEKGVESPMVAVQVGGLAQSWSTAELETLATLKPL